MPDILGVDKIRAIENQINIGYSIWEYNIANVIVVIFIMYLNQEYAYAEKTGQSALKIYYFGLSWCGVGKVLGMNKVNVYNRIKTEKIILKFLTNILNLMNYIILYNF